MDANSRAATALREIDNISKDIDQTSSEAVAALQTIADGALAAINDIHAIRDNEVAKRKAFIAAKEAARNA